MTFFLIAVLCSVVVAFVLLPLRAPSAASAAAFADANESIGRKSLVEKQRALKRQIGDLEFDNSLGKINSDDFSVWSSDLNAQLSDVKTQLQHAAPKQTESSTRWDDFDLETEVLVARARRKRVAQSTLSANSWTCSCGRAMSDADRFCASCGAARAEIGEPAA